MTTSIGISSSDTLHLEIRHVPLGRSVEWLNRGWDDCKRIGRAGLAHGVLIAILGAVLLALGSTHMYLTAAAITGYLLVGPVMTTGLCELARRREAREPLGFDESLQALARNPDGLLHFGGILALIALLGIVFALSAVAVPLIIDRHASASEAMRASLRVTFANLPAMLVWAGLIVGLTAIGFLTLLVGMVVVAPLLGYATWHAYRDLIV